MGDSLMSMGTRIFLVDGDDTVRRFPLSHFERLRREDPNESLPEFAGKRVRCAHVVLELSGRKPVEIIQLGYFMLFFDSRGRLDRSEREKAKELAVNMVPSYTDQTAPESVVDAEHHFAKKEYADRYKWTPTPEIEAAIFDAIFGKRPA
jgi:hypothetical protein